MMINVRIKGLSTEKTFRMGVLFLIFIVMILSAGSCYSRDGEFKNVILLVADGMGSAHTTLARWCKGAPLNLDDMHIGGLRTYSADSLITDSAPAATAYASGYKSSHRFIGIMSAKPTIPGVSDPKSLRFKPVASVLEGARLTGRSTGLVATSNIQHATPASFSAHWPDRNDFEEIAKQQAYQEITVVLGGGRNFLSYDLADVIRAKGYTVVTNRDEMSRSRPVKLWGIFADNAMAYDVDRKIIAPDQPSLGEMTKKAIEVLAQNAEGFFLFVEGSKIDWISHAHDPTGVVSEILAFDEAVGISLDFARARGDTIVIVVSDHGTGGMSIGSLRSDGIYSHLQYESMIAFLAKASLTGEGIEFLLKDDRTEGRIKQIVHTYLGISDLTPKEIKDIQTAPPGEMVRVTGSLVNSRSYIGWTTKGHTGEDLFFYYYGIDRPFTLLENTDIAKIMANAMGFDLVTINNRLFVEAGEAFIGTGAEISFDRADAKNQKLIIKKPGKRAEIPLSTNSMKIAGKRKAFHTLEGIAVFAPNTGKAYIPRQAVKLFDQAE